MTLLEANQSQGSAEVPAAAQAIFADAVGGFVAATGGGTGPVKMV